MGYALALIATIPASVAFRNTPWRTGVAGTIWNGEVGVAGGSTVRWNWDFLRSLTSLSYAATWKATGPDTDLGGRVLRGWTSTVFDNVSGSADASLLRAVQPNLAFTCDLAMQVEIEKLVLGGGGRMMQGQIATDPGSCRPRRAGAASPVPALLIKGEKIGTESRIRITPMAQQRKVLATIVLGEDGDVDLNVTPDGAAALPFLGVPAGARIQGQM